MKKRVVLGVLLGGLVLLSAGCSNMQNLNRQVGSLLNSVIYLAIIALPIALAYYFYKKD